MFEIIDETDHVVIDRNVDRIKTYDNLYWSANKVNFLPSHMPQFDQGKYRGKLFVAIAKTHAPFHDAIPDLLKKKFKFAQIMEAFWFGVHKEKLALKHKSILVPGSTGHPPDSSCMFCPILFEFGNHVSLGIEILKTNGIGGLILPAKTKILLMEA